MAIQTLSFLSRDSRYQKFNMEELGDISPIKPRKKTKPETTNNQTNTNGYTFSVVLPRYKSLQRQKKVQQQKIYRKLRSFIDGFDYISENWDIE